MWQEVVNQYKMDDMEGLAYRCCLLWIEYVEKYFPNENLRRTGISIIPKYLSENKGDPRKSLVFKYCFKFVRESQNIIPPEQFHLFIRAQLDILRHVNTGKGYPEISPNCLVGDKAWKRWKLWKRKYDAISAKPSEVPEAIGPGVQKALAGLERTKEFLAKTLGASPGLDKYREAYLNNNLFRWANFGKISPYYLVISPHIAAVMKPDDLKRLNFDPTLYKSCITDEVMRKFKEMFPHE